MRPISIDTIRIFLHLLAVCIWVGGQFTLAAAARSLRSAGPEAAGSAARAFARLAWPAYGIAWVTGIWNLWDVRITEQSTSYQVTVAVKLGIILLSGLVAFIHLNVGRGVRAASSDADRARIRRRAAILGMLSAFTALAALLLGASLGH